MKNLIAVKLVEQEQNVSTAFSKQSSTFDETDAGNEVLQWMRSRIREDVMKFWHKREHILELNAGTGIDALYFAQKGFYVHATDNAPGMLRILEKKVRENQLQDKISTQHCSFLELENIGDRKFDHIFSNFGGLNCTPKLDKVIASFSPLLKPCGTVTMVLMPPVCPWEMLYVLKGNFKLAFRRFKRNGTISHLEGVRFTTWYYKLDNVIKMLQDNYEILNVRGLGITVPPPFLGSFPRKHPGLFKKLTTIEDSISTKAPYYSWADHFMITAMKIK